MNNMYGLEVECEYPGAKGSYVTRCYLEDCGLPDFGWASCVPSYYTSWWPSSSPYPSSGSLWVTGSPVTLIASVFLGGSSPLRASSASWSPSSLYSSRVECRTGKRNQKVEGRFCLTSSLTSIPGLIRILGSLGLLEVLVRLGILETVYN